MQVDLTNHVALVTGAAHRVGKAIAMELARRGAHIVVHYHSSSDEVVRDTVQDIKSLGVDAYAVQADVSTPDGVTKIFEAIREHFGRLNILVNSASVFPEGSLLDISYEEWQHTMNVNAGGPFLCTQQAVKMMRENDPAGGAVGGAIVNIVDQGAIKPWPSRPHHGISKAALWMLTQTSAVNFAPDIRVNAVLPGPVLPPPGASDERWEQIGKEQTLLQRTGHAEDVARAVAFLVSEDFITGALIEVNGGEHLTGTH